MIMKSCGIKQILTGIIFRIRYQEKMYTRFYTEALEEALMAGQ
jgi:hypothetical protein